MQDDKVIMLLPRLLEQFFRFHGQHLREFSYRDPDVPVIILLRHYFRASAKLSKPCGVSMVGSKE
jgi:hypothetical protein